MSLDQGINHKKEHRKQYRGAKAVDKTCRNHGGCPWCEENRMYSKRRRETGMEEREREDWDDDWDDEEDF